MNFQPTSSDDSHQQRKVNKQNLLFCILCIPIRSLRQKNCANGRVRARQEDPLCTIWVCPTSGTRRDLILNSHGAFRYYTTLQNLPSSGPLVLWKIRRISLYERYTTSRQQPLRNIRQRSTGNLNVVAATSKSSRGTYI